MKLGKAKLVVDGPNRREWISTAECPTPSFFKFMKCSDDDPDLSLLWKPNGAEVAGSLRHMGSAGKYRRGERSRS